MSISISVSISISIYISIYQEPPLLAAGQVGMECMPIFLAVASPRLIVEFSLHHQRPWHCNLFNVELGMELVVGKGVKCRGIP